MNSISNKTIRPKLSASNKAKAGANTLIALDLQTFRQSRESAVTGVIFLNLRNGAFPERGWSDFPVTILGWWADALLQMEMPTARQIQWIFMDGPYVLTLSKSAEVVSADVFELYYVHKSLLEAAESVVAYCDLHRMFSKDLETLNMHAGRLRAQAMQPRTTPIHIKMQTSGATASR